MLYILCINILEKPKSYINFLVELLFIIHVKKDMQHMIKLNL